MLNYDFLMEDGQDFSKAGKVKFPCLFKWEERMKIKVMIVDSVVDTVLGDNEAMQSNLQVEIVDFDRDTDNKESLNTHYEDKMQDIPFSIIHPE